MSSSADGPPPRARGASGGAAAERDANGHGAHWLALALALALGPAIVNGFARFCYALVLPAMQASLEWSYTAAGWLNGANAIGYLIGAIAAPRVLARFGARRAFVFGNGFTVATLIAMGLVSAYPAMLAIRMSAGVVGSIVFVTGGALASSISSDPRINAACVAIYFSGIGAAMLVSGLALPPALAAWGDGAWWIAWLMLGLVALLASVPAAWAARNVRASESTRVGASAPVPWRRFLPALVGYFGFGLGFIGYLTFIVALLRAQNASTGGMVFVWVVLCIGMLSTPWVWRRPLAQWSGAAVLAAGNLFTALGAALALVDDSILVLALSALVFGGAFLSTAAAITAFSKQEMAPAAWGRGIAGFTTAFALGQIAGPPMTGWIADRMGSLVPGLAVSAAILLVAAAIAYAQRRTGSREDRSGG